MRIPPLRERPDDIELLACHFAARAGMRICGHPLNPTRADLAALRSHAWPGNVRELAAVIERAAILGAGQALHVAGALTFAQDHSAHDSAREQPDVSARVSSRPQAPLRTLQAVINEHIEAALAATKGRVEGPHGAAALLDINPHTLRARMRKFGINWARFRAGESAASTATSRGEASADHSSRREDPESSDDEADDL
jgi:DNA-binding NtrC family response regulator